MGRSAEAYQQQQENESGMDDCELDHYENQLVCVYCGNDMVESYISCCGEVHFDTEENIDNGRIKS
tara:strand:+ start:1542 stop:1739 length:198 start_codon:yes stop_codon:yes gene_type:complete